MNLHNVVAGTIASVNPMIAGSLLISNGFSQDANYQQQPAYLAPIAVQVQLQPLAYKDLIQIEGINVQGQKVAMYVNGDVQAIVRADSKGGDLITLADGTRWLIVQVLEDFSRTAGWVKVAAARQQ